MDSGSDDADNVNNNNFELEEATNDYSSYWQSIPDPPTPKTTRYYQQRQQQ